MTREINRFGMARKYGYGMPDPDRLKIQERKTFTEKDFAEFNAGVDRAKKAYDPKSVKRKYK